jgi:AcrR family transcriptional regulator
MRKVPATERHPKKRRPVRIGRPPQKLAVEVDARILDAARSLFLERGLEGTSVDEIASLARAGKPTIYARFPSKETLFTAVVLRAVLASIERFEIDAPTGASVRLRHCRMTASSRSAGVWGTNSVFKMYESENLVIRTSITATKGEHCLFLVAAFLVRVNARSRKRRIR